MCDQPPDKMLDFYAVKVRHRMLSITGPWRPNKWMNNLLARADREIDFTSRKKTILILAFEDGSKILNQFGIYVSFGPFFCHNLIAIQPSSTILLLLYVFIQCIVSDFLLTLFAKYTIGLPTKTDEPARTSQRQMPFAANDLTVMGLFNAKVLALNSVHTFIS